MKIPQHGMVQYYFIRVQHHIYLDSIVYNILFGDRLSTVWEKGRIPAYLFVISLILKNIIAIITFFQSWDIICSTTVLSIGEMRKMTRKNGKFGFNDFIFQYHKNCKTK